MSVSPGQIVGGRYHLTERIAVGGMGEVWRAHDPRLDREVAVKVLKAEYSQDATFLERFRNEARSAAGLSHPNIAGIFDYGEASGDAFLVMELVPGEPLNQLIAVEGAIEPRRAMRLLAQAARGLAAAHAAGVVHRDVKPGNLLITPSEQVKITDFGIARAGDSVPLTQTGQVMGTAQYLSPEQASGQVVTGSSDLYALGVVGYEMLAGSRPFDGGSPVTIAMAHVNQPPPSLPDTLPGAARALIASALAKTPAERPANGQEFARLAQLIADGEDAKALRQLPASALAAAGLAAGAAAAAGATQMMPADATRPMTAFQGGPYSPDESAADNYGRTYSPQPYAQSAPPAPQRKKPPVAAIATVLLLILALLLFGIAWLNSNNKETPTQQPTQTSSTTTSAPASTSSATSSKTRTSATSTSTSSSSTTAASKVTVDAGRYIGQDKDTVTDELTKLGLKPSTKADPNGSGDPDTVTKVEPSGQVDPGAKVTVYFVEKKTDSKPTKPGLPDPTWTDMIP